MPELVHIIMILFVITLLFVLLFLYNKYKMGKLTKNIRLAEINIIDSLEKTLPKELVDNAVDIVSWYLEKAIKNDI